MRGKALSRPPLFDQLCPYLGYSILSGAISTTYLALKKGLGGVRFESRPVSLIERLCFPRGGGGWGCLSGAEEKVVSIMREMFCWG